MDPYRYCRSCKEYPLKFEVSFDKGSVIVQWDGYDRYRPINIVHSYRPRYYCPKCGDYLIIVEEEEGFL